MKKINIKVPTSWAEITLETFDKIQKSLSDNPKDVDVVIIKDLTGLTDKEIEEMSVQSFNDIVKSLEFLTRFPLQKKLPKDHIELAGKKFKVLLYPYKMTASQFLDYRAMTMNENPDKFQSARLISIFMTLEEGEMEFEDKVQLVYKHMPIEYAIGLAYFFEMVFNVFMNHSLHCSMLGTKAILKAEKDKKIKEQLKDLLNQMKNTKKEFRQMMKDKKKVLRVYLTKSTGNK